MARLADLFLIALVTLVISTRLTASRKTIHFSYITSKTGSFVASGGIPAVDLALEQINNRTDILSNYTLQYNTIHDSKCNRTAALDSFMDDFRNVSNPMFVSLLCCGCSSADLSVAEVSHYWNIAQMAGIAGTDELNDRVRFRGFHRTDASSQFVGAAMAEMARSFNWTQMAMITQDESLFLLIKNSLQSIFETENKSLDTSILIPKGTGIFPYHLLNWGRDYRIIMLNVVQSMAFATLCEAYYRGWFAPEYVFITYSWYNNGWWEQGNGNASCTLEIMRRMVKDSLAITPKGNLVSANRTLMTTSGLTPEEFENMYLERLRSVEYRDMNLTEFILSGSLFDAMWALAIGLNTTATRVASNDSNGCNHFPGELVPLEDFDYSNEVMGCVLRDSFQQVNFVGVTGNVSFNSNGSRDANVIRVEQYKELSDGTPQRVPMASITILVNSSYFRFLENFNVSSFWEGGAPYDGAAVKTLHTNNIALIVIYSIAATAGLVYAVVCFLFNTLCRKKKVVKLSSPNLNYLIIAGAALFYIAVFMYVFTVQTIGQSTLQTFLCNLRQWCHSFGYTLCFGVILAKTWRVYYIFNNPTPKKKIPKDWLLLIVVLVVVAVDTIIFFTGTAIPSSRLNATLVNDIEHPTSVSEDGVNQENVVFVCINDYTVVWLAITYAYKALLQLVAMFMAFHTRQIKIKALNDSKEIAVIVYFNSITLVLLAVVEFALTSYHDVFAALFGLTLLVGATLFLSMIFIPKMIQLYKDPDGTSVLEPTTSKGDFAGNTGFGTMTKVPDKNDDNVKLKRRIAELEEKLLKVNDGSHCNDDHVGVKL